LLGGLDISGDTPYEEVADSLVENQLYMQMKDLENPGAYAAEIE